MAGAAVKRRRRSTPAGARGELAPAPRPAGMRPHAQRAANPFWRSPHARRPDELLAGFYTVSGAKAAVPFDSSRFHRDSLRAISAAAELEARACPERSRRGGFELEPPGGRERSGSPPAKS